MKFCKPSFCFITPTSYLEGFANRSTTHLVLAHLVDTDPIYAKYYKQRSLFGDFIMLDNSAYELKEPYSPDKLVSLAAQCGAQAIVLPDYPFQYSYKTIDAAKQFIPIFKDNGYKTFFVPQSERGNFNDWVNCYKWAAEHDDIDIIGMSILGIPNAIPEISPAYARVVMSALLTDRQIFAYDKHHHYLGLNSGPSLEIPSLLGIEVLDSIDSSGPVQAALMGHSYTKDADSFQMVKKLKMPVDFSVSKTKDITTIERISHNIQLTLSLFEDKNKNNNEAWYAIDG